MRLSTLSTVCCASSRSRLQGGPRAWFRLLVACCGGLFGGVPRRRNGPGANLGPTGNRGPARRARTANVLLEMVLQARAASMTFVFVALVDKATVTTRNLLSAAFQRNTIFNRTIKGYGSSRTSKNCCKPPDSGGALGASKGCARPGLYAPTARKARHYVSMSMNIYVVSFARLEIYVSLSLYTYVYFEMYVSLSLSRPAIG